MKTIFRTSMLYQAAEKKELDEIYKKKEIKKKEMRKKGKQGDHQIPGAKKLRRNQFSK
jgi:hypothetical protein